MAKKNLTKSNAKPKSKSASHAIDQLNACIQADQIKLVKAYEKAIASTQKPALQLAAKLDKLTKKAKSATAKAGKEKPVNKVEQAAIISMQKELILLKNENLFLATGYKKFIAQQKAIKAFEKDWRLNTTNNKAKTKKSVKSKEVVKTKNYSIIEPTTHQDVE
jgi:hypothetical protein